MSDSKIYDVIAIGEILIDFTPVGKDEAGDAVYARKAGGAPPNLLACAAAFGKKTAFIGKVGQDLMGVFLKDTLDQAGIGTETLVMDPDHNTTLAFVQLDETGDRDFCFYRSNNADIYLKGEELKTECLEQTKIFHFGSLSFTNEPLSSATDLAIAKAKASGAVISFDPNYREPLWNSEQDAVEAIRRHLSVTDILKVAKEEAQMITDTEDVAEAVKKLHAFGPQIILVTDGGNGVYYSVKHGIIDAVSGRQPSLKIKTVDTTGAGDIFFGSFLSLFLTYGLSVTEAALSDVEKCVSGAILVSGKSTLKHGGIASIPKDEIKGILSEIK